MSLDNGMKYDIPQLIEALSEGSLTDEEFARLELMLASDPHARAAYHLQVQMHAMLMFEHQVRGPAACAPRIRHETSQLGDETAHQAHWAGEPDGGFVPTLDQWAAASRNDEARQPAVLATALDAAFAVGTPSTIRGAISSAAANWHYIACFAIGVLAALAGIRLSTLTPEAPEPAMAWLPSDDTRSPVAFLASAYGCNWRDQATPWAIGQGIDSGGEVTLYEGIAEFQLASGVSLSIEGPASLILTSPTSFTVQHGKITVNVPWEVSHCQVIAGGCRLSASEAEFGVQVIQSNVNIHVFAGEVMAESTLFSGAPNLAGESISVDGDDESSEMLLSEGKSLAVSGVDGIYADLKWGEADESQFSTKLSMAGELPITDSYVKTILQSKPTGYWRFESTEGAGVPCELGSGISLDVTGELRLSRMGGNRVAVLGLPGENCALVSSAPFETLAQRNYAVEVWVKPSHYHRGAIVSLLTNPFQAQEAHAFLLELRSPLGCRIWEGVEGIATRSRFRFLHRDPPSMNPETGTSCFSTAPYSVRRWQHLVAVKEGSEMRLFVNGELAASTQDASSLVSGLHLVVGQLRSTTNYREPFIGQLDELAIYDHVLTVPEIRKHYRAVKWGNGPTI